MNQIKSSYDAVILNGMISKEQSLTPIPSGIPVVYEVIRVMTGVPLFVEDHLERMNQSLMLAGFSTSLDLHTVKEAIHVLTGICSVRDQNIRLNVWQEAGKTLWTGFFVASHYPESAVYGAGVATGLLSMARQNPNAKVWQADLKAVVAQACEVRQLYEMILVDGNGFISEGSRSNLFFSQGGTLITAPDAAVLGGITRQKLLTLVEVNGIPLVKREIAAAELESFDGAFITGTSIHLMPVARIDSWERRSFEQPLIRTLMDQFNETVQEYISAYTCK